MDTLREGDSVILEQIAILDIDFGEDDSIILKQIDILAEVSQSSERGPQ